MIAALLMAFQLATEAPLPDAVHVFQHGSVDHGVVEGERDFEDRQHDDDPQQRQRAAERARLEPAVREAEREAHGGENDRAFVEVQQGNAL